MSESPKQGLIDLVWDLTDDSEEHAQTGEVTLTLRRDQASEMYNFFWRLGGKYREGLKAVGWSPAVDGEAKP